MNFFTDNPDIRFLLKHYDIARLAELQERGFKYRNEFDFAPADADDATDNYRRAIELVGELAAEMLAPTASDTDRVGNRLCQDGSVELAQGTRENLRVFGNAGLMGFTLPYRYGGLNLPLFLYTISNELVSRADASFMNMYGLQGIAETINAFASDDIKERYLPRLASGQLTGAMVLTEPDAGSDLQSVKTRAFQDKDGNWFVSGVKRFITNGCGDVLLVLARTEPGSTDGRGLSCLLVEKCDKVHVRRLEDKLGIHGSPTCEIFFDDAPARLIGLRQRGLITYVMALMNGARIGIAAQSIGIAEAAMRAAAEYAAERKQFGVAIGTFPAIREMMAEMRVSIRGARALTYFASYAVDLERGYDAMASEAGKNDPAAGEWRREARKYRNWNKLLTPMAKYCSSEMSVRVANDAVSVLGGSGYMRDYPVERYLRDSRITTIYEGTSQLQVTAAVAGVTGGVAGEIALSMIDGREWGAEMLPCVQTVRDILAALDECIASVKAHPDGTAYRDLCARKLVDIASIAIIGALLCDEAADDETRFDTLAFWLSRGVARTHSLRETIISGDTTALRLA